MSISSIKPRENGGVLCKDSKRLQIKNRVGNVTFEYSKLPLEISAI